MRHVRTILHVVGHGLLWPSPALLLFQPTESFRTNGLYLVAGIVVGFALAALSTLRWIPREERDGTQAGRERDDAGG